MAADHTHTPEGPSSTVALSTGRAMPVMGLGTWELTDDTASIVTRAIDLGYRMIDTSSDYGTQPGVAEALRRTLVPREDLFVVTKVEEDEDAYEAAGRRVDELGVDRLDLLLIHRPPGRGGGVDLWRGLRHRPRDEGLTADIGVSNYSVEQIDVLVEATGEVPAVNQIEWTPFGWSQVMLEYCDRRDIAIQAYSPLTRATNLDDPTLVEIADEVERSPTQVLIRWDLQLGVVPIPKANDIRHTAENLRVFDFSLDDEAMRRLMACNEHASALGSSLQYV